MQIELSPQERVALIAILRRVGGNPRETARGYAEAVLNRLYESGPMVDLFGFQLFEASDATALYFTPASRGIVDSIAKGA